MFLRSVGGKCNMLYYLSATVSPLSFRKHCLGTKIRIFPWFYRVPQSKFKANWSRDHDLLLDI